MKRVSIPTVIAFIALIVILAAYAVTFQVRFNEKAVRIGLMRSEVQVEEGAGLYFRWPYPFERINYYDTRLHIIETPETELKTADGQNLIVGCYAVWKIANPALFSQRLPGDDKSNNYRDAEDKLRTRINEARQAVIGRHTMGELFNLDAGLVAKGRDKIHQEMKEAAAPALRDNFGIELVSVAIRRNTVPEDATQAILQSMSSERATLAAQFIQEGKSRADAIRSAANAGKEKIMAFAQRKAARIRSEGDAAAARIIEQIRSEDSDLFVWLRYLDALESALKEKSTIFLDWESDLFRVFKAPLNSPPPTETGRVPSFDAPGTN
jgi:membrane protease subunit HflC